MPQSLCSACEFPSLLRNICLEQDKRQSLLSLTRKTFLQNWQPYKADGEPSIGDLDFWTDDLETQSARGLTVGSISVEFSLKFFQWVKSCYRVQKISVGLTLTFDPVIFSRLPVSSGPGSHRSRIRYLSKKNSRILTNFPKLKKIRKNL